MSTVRSCVYTALIGDYEKLNEQPVANSSRLPFICFTDDPELRSETWQIQRVSLPLQSDPIRSQRAFKLRPQDLLPEFNRSLYIDNSVVLTEPPERLLETEPVASSVFSLPQHSFRETVLDEFLEVSRLGLDDQSTIFEQLNHYTIECPDVLQEKPWWGGILIRDHHSESVRIMLEIWLCHVLRYSRRDQLSVNLAFRKADLKPTALPIDNYASWFHTWPHALRRDRDKGNRLAATSLMPPAARIRSLEQALAEKKQENEQRRAELQDAAQALAEKKQENEQWRAELQDAAQALAEKKQENEQWRAELRNAAQALAKKKQENEQWRAELQNAAQALAEEKQQRSVQIERLETALLEADRRSQVLLSSTSWQVTAPLRAGAMRYARFADIVLLGSKRVWRVIFRNPFAGHFRRYVQANRVRHRIGD